jgi:hypothetical protein
MGGHPFLEISCKICAKPVDLNVDLFADENGKAVHEECYVNHIAKRKRTETWRGLRLCWQESKFVQESLPD